MRLNSMLATVLIFLCSLVISSCSNDELAPISLKNRETANIKLNTGSTRLRTVIPSAPANLDIKNVSATT